MTMNRPLCVVVFACNSVTNVLTLGFQFLKALSILFMSQIHFQPRSLTCDSFCLIRSQFCILRMKSYTRKYFATHRHSIQRCWTLSDVDPFSMGKTGELFHVLNRGHRYLPRCLTQKNQSDGWWSLVVLDATFASSKIISSMCFNSQNMLWTSGWLLYTKIMTFILIKCRWWRTAPRQWWSTTAVYCSQTAIY